MIGASMRCVAGKFSPTTSRTLRDRPSLYQFRSSPGYLCRKAPGSRVAVWQRVGSDDADDASIMEGIALPA